MNISIKCIFTVQSTSFGSTFSQFCSVLCCMCCYSVGEKTDKSSERIFGPFKDTSYKSMEGQELREAAVWILNVWSALQNKSL